MGHDGPFVISAPGQHTVEYWSTDNLNNREAMHLLIVKIDTVAPIITAASNPATASKNPRPVTVTISGNASDILSGTSNASFNVIDEYGVTQPSGAGYPRRSALWPNTWASYWASHEARGNSVRVNFDQGEISEQSVYQPLEGNVTFLRMSATHNLEFTAASHWSPSAMRFKKPFIKQQKGGIRQHLTNSLT